MNDKKITKDMTFGEVLKDHPQVAHIFLKYGMHCIGCHIAPSETIEQGAVAHGVDVDTLVNDLNNHLAGPAPEKEE